MAQQSWGIAKVVQAAKTEKQSETTQVREDVMAVFPGFWNTVVSFYIGYNYPPF